MPREQALDNLDRLAANQLLGVLVEILFNPENARVLYERLKTTTLFNAVHRQWDRAMDEWQEIKNTDCYTQTQLIDVLVEAKLLEILPHKLTEDLPPLPVTRSWQPC